MFNLLVSGRGWAQSRDFISGDRLFEYTDPQVASAFRQGDRVDFVALCRHPALILEETYGKPDKEVRLVNLTHARLAGSDIALEYVADADGPPLTNGTLEALARELDIEDFEFSRTHWAVKDVDLFRVLLRNTRPQRPQSRVFQLQQPERIESNLVSAMMPFKPSFDAVVATLKNVSKQAGLRCRRADDIWDNPAVIQDVVSLIDKSRIVIVDCTGRNPNVFYEAGIAHTLGRDVILITQNEADIPFDLHHLRYVKYLNNREGLRELKQKLLQRLRDAT